MRFSKLPLLGLIGVSVVLAFFLRPVPVESKVPYVDTVLGRMVEGVLALASRSGLEVTSAFRRVQATPQERARLDRAMARVKWAARNRLRYQESQHWVLIQGLPSEPNAFAVGEALYFSRSLLDKLNDSQLVAVMAHEVAHAERGHLLERMGNGYAGVLVHLWQTFEADWAYLSRGEINQRMRELMDSGHWTLLTHSLQEAEMGQEIQADCIAWQWLQRMKDAGWATGPDEILSSIETLIGVRSDSLALEESIAGRVGYLASGAHHGSRCE
jgi:predicted Zn-dependent protease